MGKHDVYSPLATDALRPSVAQSRIVSDMKDGAKLVGRFDVWGGYDWLIVRENGMTSKVTRATVQGLLNRGLITKGETVRIASGRHDTAFTLASPTP